METPWTPGDVIAAFTVVVALAALVVSIVTNGRTVRRALHDRHLSERMSAYAEFLTSQDAQFDGYNRFRTGLGPDLATVDPDSAEAAACRADIDEQRVAAWAVRARLQLLAPRRVQEAADAYADAITAANPLRKLPGRGNPYVGWGSDRKVS